MTKMKVCVFLLVEKKKELIEFNLPDDALITDLKEALAKKEGHPDANRLFMFLKTPEGHELGTLSVCTISPFSPFLTHSQSRVAVTLI